MSSEADRHPGTLYRLPKAISDALNKSEGELLRLATYYHQIGRIEKAEEIYRTILKINKRTSMDRDTNDVCARTAS